MYIVKQTKEPSGIMFAVIYNGNFLFSKKKKEDAKKLATKLNKLYEKRLNIV